MNRKVRMLVGLTCECVHTDVFSQVITCCQAEQTASQTDGSRKWVSNGEGKKKKKIQCLTHCGWGGGGRMWWPVLVPPPLCSSQPVSGSLPPPPADFSLGGGEKNCPLSLTDRQPQSERCPPDINQHTHSPQRASLTDTQPFLLLAFTCKWDVQPLRSRRGTGY